MTKQKDDGSKVAQLAVEGIAMNDWNGSRKPDKEFIASVKEKGILQPILVRPLADENAKGSAVYQVVCGSRRLQAAVACGMELIPAVVREMTDEEAREATLVENIQRESLSPLEEADAVCAMLKVKDAAGIASAIGRTKRYVAECRRIAESLTAGAKKALARKDVPEIPRECLALIASVPQKEQLRFIENVADNGSEHLLADVSWVRSAIFEEMAPLGDGCPFDQTDEGLKPEAGACSTCPKRTGSDPDLFGGVFAKADKCGDPACYAAKMEAHAEKAIAAALEKHPDAKKGFISKFLTSEAQGELANVADEIQEYEWGRGLGICKKKDEGSVKYVLIYPLEKAGQIVYARKPGQKSKGDGSGDGKTETGRLKGPEMLKRRRLAWMLKTLADEFRKAKGLSSDYDADDKVLLLVGRYGAPSLFNYEPAKAKEPIRASVFRSMLNGIAEQELRFNLVSAIDPDEAMSSMKRVLAYVDDAFEDSYDKLAANAAEEIGGGKKRKAKSGGAEEADPEVEEETEE